MEGFSAVTEPGQEVSGLQGMGTFGGGLTYAGTTPAALAMSKGVKMLVLMRLRPM